MSKEEIDYQAELVKSLKRENDLLTKENERLKSEVEELRETLRLYRTKIMMKSPAFCEETEEEDPINFLHNLNWEKFHFKNGKCYELALVNSDGVFTFKDSIFSNKFDEIEIEDWDKSIRDWEKCSLKPLLEKWWKENAPDFLKDNYKITILVNHKLCVYNGEVVPACIPISNKEKFKNTEYNLESNETSRKIVGITR